MSEIILFDLDGTLTDSKEGITKCVQYGMEAVGCIEPDLDKLTVFVGPPLYDMFIEHCKFTPDQAKLAVEKYRERFREKGIYENAVYEGVPELLAVLKSVGKRLGVATSKPWVFAEPILRDFKIRDYFEHVVGSELDGERVKKADVIREALRQFGAEEAKEKVLMVGDREHDIIGAREAGVASVGVLYGYGSLRELEKAGAEKTVATVEELRELLLHDW